MDKAQLLEKCGNDKKLAARIVEKCKESGTAASDMMLEWEKAYGEIPAAGNGEKVLRAEMALACVWPSNEKANVREKILFFGGTSSGKTYSALKVLEESLKKNKDSEMYIIDVDDGVIKVLNSEFPKLIHRVHYYPCLDFEEILKAFDEIKEKVKESDWIVLEATEQIWTMAQSEFVEKVYGASIDEALLESRRRLVAAGKINQPASIGESPLVDWQVIKSRHNGRLLDPLAKHMKCNVIVTSEAKELLDIGDMSKQSNKDVRDIFGELGYAPGGEKRNMYRLDSIFFLSRELDSCTCRKCSTVYSTRVKRCKCGAKELDIQFGYYVESLKDRGHVLFGKTSIGDNVYATINSMRAK